MAKLVETVNDFSGGIVKGYSPERLRNNQLQECKNLVSDGVGTLQGVPSQESGSTMDIDGELPSYKAKNIHAWSTDTNLVTTGASSYSTTPAVSEVQVAKRARIVFYWNAVDEYDALQFSLKDNVTDSTVWSHSVNHDVYGDIPDKDNSHPNRIQGVTVREWENNIHDDNANTTSDYKVNNKNWKWNTHTEMESVIGQQGSARFGVTYNITEPTNFDHLNEWDDFHWERSNSGDNTSVPPNSLNNGEYVVTAIRHSDFYTGSWSNDTTVLQKHVFRTMMTFDYFGRVDTLISKTTPAPYLASPNSGTFSIAGTSDTVGWDRFNANNSNTTSNFVGTPSNLLSSNVSEDQAFAKHLGQFSIWEYVFELNSPLRTADYNVEIKLYSNVAQTTQHTINITYTNELGESAEDILNALGNKIVEKISEDAPLQSVKYEQIDGTKIHIFQDEDTPKPFGIKGVTSTVTNITNATVDSLTSGQSFQNLIAIANRNTQTSVYSVDNDNWLDYPIDLRDDDSVNQDCKLNYTDAEGYLKVSDADFHSDTKPKWFGFLNMNNYTYVDNTFTANGEFYIDDVSPVPYRVQASSGTHTGQNSHMVFKKDDIFRPTAVNATEFKVVSNSTGSDSPQFTGIKLAVDFCDGTNNSYEKIEGVYKKDEIIEFYWSYIYQGGSISEVYPFYASNGDAVSFKPGADDASLGMIVKMGSKMISGTGSNDMHNKRLKGVEIWGRFTKFDPNNVYQLAELDLIKGWKSTATGTWKPFTTISHNSVKQGYATGNPNASSSDVSIKDYIIYKGYPPISFYSKYGIQWDTPRGWASGAGWKTSCVFNRKAYYGNIRMMNHDGTLTYYPDGVVKTPVGLYDTVSVDNLIEATINDGDEITCLRVAGNKLCQFKRKSLTIMGVKILENGDSTEVIEQTVNHCGISGDNQVTDTPYGIMWVSRSGIWIFDGENIKRLTENLEGSTISKQNWESFYTDRTHIGYDAYWNQAHICQDTQNNPKTLIYNFNTRGFSESNKMYASDQKTGFVNNSEGNLLWGQLGTGSSTQSSSSNNNPKRTDADLPQENFPETDWDGGTSHQ